MKKKNYGLTRIDGHRSHVGNKGSARFLQKIDFQEFQDRKLSEWFKKYKSINHS
jgi:hypothetical protein